MDDPDLEHLSPDFDPQSVTIPRLRAILLAHDVDYPASAKKQQLVDLFNESVAPQAKRILKSRAHTKPSSKGITDAPSTRASSVHDDEDPTLVAPSVEETPRRASRRSTPRAGHAPSNRSSAAPSSRASTVDRKRSSFSDSGDYGHAESHRRTRTSLAIPSIKEEPHDTPVADESPFSYDNPFQSGSSPAADDSVYLRRSEPASAKTPSKTTHRRQTSGASAAKRTSLGHSNGLTRRDSARRASPDIDDIVTEDDASEVVDEDDEDISDEAGEEFTPEEQYELDQANDQSGKALARTRRQARSGRSSGPLRSAPWAVLIALLGGFATVWRQEKLNVGYCGIGRPSTSLGGVQIPEWAKILQPECEPCPQHAYCFSSLQTTCEPDFILKPHPLSLAGLVPVAPTCEPDGEKARKVKAVADRAVNELRERNAQWECGELRDEGGARAKGPELAEQDLKAIVGKKRRRGMSQDEFEELWSSALGEMLGRDEVSGDVDGTSGRRQLRSNSLARLGLACAVRRSVRLALARHLWKLVALMAITCAILYARISISSRKTTEEQAKRLASIALDRLATQAAMNQRDSALAPEAWISMAQLRDDILRNEFSSSKRQRIWEKVRAKVENNSNVRPMVRQGRTGEVSRVWEWIGAVRSADDAPGAAGSKQATVAGVAVEGSGSKREGSSSLSSLRRWADSRPVY